MKPNPFSRRHSTDRKKRATSRSFRPKQAQIITSLLFTVGLISSQANEYIGKDAGSNETKDVTEVWSGLGDLFVGYSGTGTLNIEQGGYVSNAEGNLGYNANSNGTATVSGTWANSNSFYVGYSGTGTLNIEQGGYVSNAFGFLGYNANSNGTATVSGTWANSSSLFVGNSGTGTLNIEQGGYVSNTAEGVLGANANSNGTATVSGTWANSAALVVGYSGTGTLNIEQGGYVSNSAGFLGLAANSKGTATVRGTWKNSSNLAVGYYGTGTLNIEQGGYVSNAEGNLGYYTNSNGTATVSGTWANSSGLYVGNSGTGTLNIEQGGYVSNAEGNLGYNANSNGTATVSGTWANSTGLYVGNSGTGTLNIEQGGVVYATAISIGVNGGSTGTLNLNSGGILVTRVLAKGAGTASLKFDGGTLRATQDNNDYLSNFAATDVTLGSGGVIFDTNGHNIGVSTALSGSGGLTKSGSGTLALSGSSSYTGVTSVTAGNLAVNGGLHGNGGLAVESGATLSGIGVVAGAVTIKDGGILAAGNSPGTLTLGSLSLSSGSITNFELGTTSDLIAVTGNLTLGGMLNITGITGFANDTYTLFTYGGELANNYFTLDLVPEGWNRAQFTIDLDTAGAVKLLVNNTVTIQYWDGGDTAAHGGPSGGNGIWSNAGTNWTNSNGSLNTNWQGIVAVFSGSAGTVSVADEISFSQLQFATDGYTLEAGGGSLLATGTAELYTGANVSAEITAGIGQSGTAAIVKTGSGTLTLSGSNSYEGGTTVRSGTLAVDGTISHTTADTVVGSINGDTGTLVIHAEAAVSNRESILGSGNSSNGTAIVRGTWVSSGMMTVGNSGVGKLNIEQGGYVSNANAHLAYNANSQGTATVSGAWAIGETLFVGVSGTGTLNIEDGGTVSAASVTFGSNASGVGSLNLNSGGILITGSVGKGLGTASLKFGGGTLRATRDNNDYLSHFAAGDVTLATGGVIFDTNGHNIGVSTALSGTGGLTKSGSGTLALSGSSSYSGGTVIAAGTLETQNQHALGSGDVTLREGTTLKVTGGVDIGGGFLWDGGILKLGIGTSTDTIHITGAMDNRGGGYEFSLTAGTGYAINTAYTLLTFGDSTHFSLTGLNANLIGDLGATFRLVNTGNTLQVIYLGALVVDDNVIEIGEGTTTPEVGSVVFTEEGGSVIVHGTAPVVSDTITSGSGSATIVDGTLSTEEEFHINNEGSLTITSTLETGTSGGGLVKTGSGTLVLLGSNGYTGNTVIESGTLAVANDNNLGVGGDVEFKGGTLQALGTFETERDALLGTVGGGIDVVASQTLTWNGIVADMGSPAGGLTKTGSGTLVLTHSNTYTGGTTIDEGSLRTENPHALGSGAVVLNSGATLDVATKLEITSFTWNGGGVISLSPQSGHLLAIDGALIKGTPGVFAFSFASDGFDFNATYTVMTFGLNDGFILDDFSAPIFFGITPNFSFQTDGSLAVRYLGASTGTVIENKGPTFTPSNANFVVSGTVATSGPGDNNTVNSLLFQNGSSLQVYNRLTVTAGFLTVVDGRALLHGGEVYAPGDLTKSGAGTLVSDADLTAVGAAHLEQGGLIVNGSLTAGDGVTISHSALLGGSGVVNGSVTNHGVVSPGNSPGTLTFNGDYVQANNGAFLLEIGGKSHFDRLIVNGMATLSGALNVIPYGGYPLEYGQKFTFIKSAKLRGAFDEINLPSSLRGRILSKQGDATLLIAPESYTQVAATPNQRNVASALDRFIGAGGDRDTVSTALDELRADEYQRAFNQIAPTFYESLAAITIEQSNAQGQMLQQRFGAVRFGGIGSRGFSQIGLDLPVITDKNIRKTTGSKETRDIMEVSGDNPWGIWAQGNGIFGKTSGVDDIRSYDTDSGGFLLGADYRWSDRFTTGLYTGYQATKSRYEGGGSTSINAARFGAYATLDTGNGFYANGLLGGGYSDYQVRRTIEFGALERTARSNPNGGEFTAMLGSGYDWKAGGFTFGPVTSAQYTYVKIAGFSETGARSLNLQLTDQEAHSLRSTLGARVAYPWRLRENVLLTPEIRASWQHEFMQGSRTLHSTLNGGSGPSLNYATTSPSRDALFAGAGVNLQLGNQWSANVYYNLNSGSGDFKSQMLSGGVNLSF